MTPREAVQFRQLMTEETAAQALVMKGEFNKEIKTLSDLIAEWDKRGKIDARLKEFAAQTKAFQAETEEFDATVAEHYQAVDKVKAREESVTAREAKLAAMEAEAIQKASALANAKDKHDAQVAADTEAMTAARADIALQQADISSQRKELGEREKVVADKLAKLKAIAG